MREHLYLKNHSISESDHSLLLTPLLPPRMPPSAAASAALLPIVLRHPSAPRSRVRCHVAAAPPVGAVAARPSAAEVARTIMELSKDGTLSAVTAAGWPLGIGARFVVDARGVPAVCLGGRADGGFDVGGRSSFHVKLEQDGSRTPQCTLLGNLSKPEDVMLVKKLHTNWEKKFGEDLDTSLLYIMSVDRVLHMDNFNEDGTWVIPSEYLDANPDPLRDLAANLVDEMNNKHAEEVQRLCNIYVDMGNDFQVTDAKMIWVDRLGFDFHVHSQGASFEVRVPFPREVSDEKGVKSAFNCMSHLAWEVDKNYVPADFEKVKPLKRIR